ncbi:MAG: hypothetical protein ACRBDX_08725 [Gammaproteobacteria bacterium]
MNIEEIVNSKAKYLRCENGVAYYALTVPYSEMVYSFPIPLNTMHDEALEAESSTIYFMNYINLAIQEGTLIKEAA